MGVKFKAILQKFEQQGEKTGWTYIRVGADLAHQIKPGQKTSIPVKGSLDQYTFQQFSLLPMGDGEFILAIKGEVRKALGKRVGNSVEVVMEWDEKPFEFSADFLNCLSDDPAAQSAFDQLPFSHRKYFSKWIDSAKTAETKARRISMSVNALSRGMGYGEMLRWAKGNRDRIS